MSQYGNTLTWSTVNAPHLCGGICDNYTYHDQSDEEQVASETSIAALIYHGFKGDLSYDTTFTSASTDFPLLSEAGCRINITNLSGVILVSEAVEKWAIKQPKTGSIKAMHFPEMTGGGGSSASVSAVSPAQTIVIRPASKVIYGTQGLNGANAGGIVQDLTLTQKISIETDEEPSGLITAAFTWKYLRTIALTVLSTGGAPAKGTTLTIPGAPSHAAGYIVKDVETKFSKGAKKAYSINATWAPCLG